MTETKASAAPSMARLTLTLFVITAVVALLLGLVNFITEDRIAALTAEKTARAMAEVMPGDYDFEPLDGAFGPAVTAVYGAKSGNNLYGYVVQTAPSGFGGTISMVTGVDLNGVVTGVSIIKMAETSGLGANASREDFRSQYTGGSGPFAVSKDGGEIDALTGATVTSRAVTKGVNAALEAVNALKG